MLLKKHHQSAATQGRRQSRKVGWKSDRIDGQKVYLTIFMSFLLGNGYLPEESGVDMSTPVHPLAPPLRLRQSNHGLSGVNDAPLGVFAIQDRY